MGKRISRIWSFVFALVALAGFSPVLTSSASALSPPQPKAEIVFTQGNRVASVRADGTDQQALTRPGSIKENGSFDTDADPVISPDGRRIAFTQYEGSVEKTDRLMVGNRDGSGARPVFAVKGIQDIKPGFTKFVSIDEPTWSPASGRLFFVLEVSKPKSKFQSRDFYHVVSIKPDGTDRKFHFRTVSDWTSANPRKGDGTIETIDVSPNGRRVLLSGYSDAGRSFVSVFNLKSGTRRLVREGEGASWSPNGSQIAFSSAFEGLGVRYAGSKGEPYVDTRIYVMNADGRGLRRLVKGYGPGRESDPDWSPDGRRILFTSDRNDRDETYFDPNEIYTIRPDGKCLSWVTNGVPAASEASWAPEKSFDSSPSYCGGQGLQPTVDLFPSRVRGESKGDPEVHLWLGPAYRGSLFTGRDHESLSYSDCGFFDPNDCKSDWAVGTNPVCPAWSRDEFDYAGIAIGLRVYRGAIVMERRYYGESSATIYTGGRRIDISGGSTWQEQLEAIDALRLIGQDQPAGDLPAAVLDSRFAGLATHVKSSFDATGSIEATARKLRLAPESVRSYIRIHQDLEAIGPVNTIDCPTGRSGGS